MTHALIPSTTACAHTTAISVGLLFAELAISTMIWQFDILAAAVPLTHRTEAVTIRHALFAAFARHARATAIDRRLVTAQLSIVAMRRVPIRGVVPRNPIIGRSSTIVISGCTSTITIGGCTSTIIIGGCTSTIVIGGCTSTIIIGGCTCTITVTRVSIIAVMCVGDAVIVVHTTTVFRH
jgi:hypothetical protein